MPERKTTSLSRRDALKLLGAAAGATALANLPAKWSTPELTAGVLPAHAQVSSVGCAGLDWSGTVTWATGNDQDLDLELTVPLPAPFTVSRAQPSEPFTSTAHSQDDSFSASITVPTGNLINGTWVAVVRNASSSFISYSFQSSGVCERQDSGEVWPHNFVVVNYFDLIDCEPECA